MRSQPTKILRLVTRLNIGGPALHAVLLSTKLDPQRFTTTLVIGEADGMEGDLSDLLAGQAVRVVRVASLRRPIRPLADGIAFGRVMRLLWREQPDVIHTHMAKAGALGRLAGILYRCINLGRQRGARTILIHTFHGHVLEGYFRPWVSRVLVAIERWLATRTDCLIAVSPTIQRELLELGIGRPAQWRVIPLGLDLSAFARLPLPNGASPVRVGMVGRLVPIKNPQLFVQALRRATSGGMGVSISGVIVGDGPLRSVVEREVEQLGLNRVVQMMGWQRDICQIYKTLGAACLTSWNEGTPVALIEAMAAGRPVVATDVGGVRDLLDGSQYHAPAAVEPGTFQITERGILVRPGDVKGLAAALATLVRDVDLRTRLGQAGRAYVMERFGSERLLNDIVALYEELVPTLTGMTSSR